MRLIDADALVENLGIKEYCEECKYASDISCSWKPDMVNICETIFDAPTIEPEQEIIHCKECEYGEQDEIGRWYCRGFGCQVGNEDGSGFCSDGERREDG